jgi:hypothetical protein
MTNLTNAEILAITKVVAGKATKASKHLAAGEYEIDVTARIKGIVTRGKDYTQEIVNKIDTWLLLGVALSKLNGATAESIIREAIEIEESEKGDTLTKKVKDEAKVAIKKLKGTTETDCNGKVTHSLSIESVERYDAEADEAA